MFSSPWFLLLLLLFPYLIWRATRRSGPAVVFSSAAARLELPKSWRQRLAWLPTAFGLIGLLFMILGLARPQEGREQAVIDAEGIAIEMVVDRSSSMQAIDFRIEGQQVDRLTAIKNVAGRFVGGDEESKMGNLDGRPSDLVGLITFARFPDAITPPTLDHRFLVSQLNHANIATTRTEDGTAIGDALAMAIEKLESIDARRGEKVKSKVVILLTDGASNAGEIDPLEAAEMASVHGDQGLHHRCRHSGTCTGALERSLYRQGHH